MIKLSLHSWSILCFFLAANFCLWSCASSKTAPPEDQILAGPVVSCGHFSIYQLSEDNKSYIQLIIDANELDLERENSWTLSAEIKGVRVRFRQYDQEVSATLCNDVRTKRIKPLKQMDAIEGSITLTISDKEWNNYKNGKRYKVDAKATGLAFDNGKTYALRINQATVGWLPG